MQVTQYANLFNSRVMRRRSKISARVSWFPIQLVASDPSFNCCTFTSKKANCPDFFNSLVNFIDANTVFK